MVLRSFQVEVSLNLRDDVSKILSPEVQYHSVSQESQIPFKIWEDCVESCDLGRQESVELCKPSTFESSSLETFGRITNPFI